MPNWSQLSGAADRIVLIFLTFAVSKGWILPADVATLATALVAVAGAAYSVYVNRNTNLAKQAASIPNTTVVTTPDIACNTPGQANIVSNDEKKVVSK
jgi:hypothetical protein